ncbi:MAG: mechanosensitive ion channel family protein [Bacteroidota bacterium]|nr:mechanosensitive ion channel family protein [Bacteroidota bacterium]
MNFLDQIYFDNTIRSYIAVAITILMAVILKRIVSKYATALIFRLGKAQWSNMDKQRFDSIIITPLERILLVIISIFALDRLNFPQALLFSVHKFTSQDIVESIAAAIIIICIVSLILRFMDFLVQVIRYKSGNAKTASEYQLLFFFKDFIKVIIIIFGIIFILKYSFRVDIGNLLTGLSIVGAALALSARESLENLIASFIIFFDKPFETGDIVQVKEVKGTVERIGLRSTRIRTVEKSLVTVPNKQMVDSILDNWSSRDFVRNQVDTQLSPNTSAENLENAVNGIKEILSHQGEIKSYNVHLQEITKDSALIISVFFTVPGMTQDEVNLLRQEIYIDIRKLQEKHEMEPSNASKITLVNTEKKT